MKPYEEENRFLHDYDSDAFKIIASYEEAANIDYNERYTRWYGDLGLFEGTAREGITYEKLCARYKAGLKYLGIVHDQADAVCGHFLSSQLADRIRTEMQKADADAGYVPQSILNEMDLPELTREMLGIDRDMEVDCDIGQEITCYIETWFDVDKKFGLRINDENDTWLNMYGKYNPFADTLRIECEISRNESSEYFDYAPSASESHLIKDMITEKIREEYGQTPKEFCDSFTAQEEKVYVYKNRGTLSAEQIIAKHNRLRTHCEECGYLQEGGISISRPMSRSGNEFKNMIDYCKVRGISKILVDSYRDIGDTPDEINKVVSYLRGCGFEVEVADSDQTFTTKNKTEDQGITMGGM